VRVLTCVNQRLLAVMAEAAARMRERAQERKRPAAFGAAAEIRWTRALES
jgi:hypothetical protein